jgi:hypothetical protein
LDDWKTGRLDDWIIGLLDYWMDGVEFGLNSMEEARSESWHLKM